MTPKVKDVAATGAQKPGLPPSMTTASSRLMESARRSQPHVNKTTCEALPVATVTAAGNQSGSRTKKQPPDARANIAAFARNGASGSKSFVGDQSQVRPSARKPEIRSGPKRWRIALMAPNV
jgi:hypothetical protein